MEAKIVEYVENNQIQHRPHRNRSRDSISQYTVYVASTRKSCRAGKVMHNLNNIGRICLSGYFFCHYYTIKSRIKVESTLAGMTTLIMTLDLTWIIFMRGSNNVKTY